MQMQESGSLIFFILLISLIGTSMYLFSRQFSIYKREKLTQQAYFLLFFTISPIFAITTSLIVIFRLQESVTLFGLFPRLMPLIPISLLFITTISQLNYNLRYMIIPAIILIIESLIWITLNQLIIDLPENIKLSLERLPQLIFVMFLLFWIILTFFSFFRTSRDYTALGFLFSAIFYTIAGFLAVSPEGGILGFLLIFTLANLIIIVSVYLAREYSLTEI